MTKPLSAILAILAFAGAAAVPVAGEGVDPAKFAETSGSAKNCTNACVREFSHCLRNSLNMSFAFCKDRRTRCEQACARERMRLQKQRDGAG